MIQHDDNEWSDALCIGSCERCCADVFDDDAHEIDGDLYCDQCAWLLVQANPELGDDAGDWEDGFPPPQICPPPNRIHEALRQLDASLPPETDAGVYYDNARRRADAIRALIAQETDAVALRILRSALDLAQYVGD